MLSSCVEEGEIEVMRAGKPKQIPDVVHIYNNSMGGVDRADQMLTSYSTERKRVKKWYKKYFHHLLNETVLNAFILSQRKGNDQTSLKFRETQIEQLFQTYRTEESKPKKRSRPNKHNVVRLVERHFPNMIAATFTQAHPLRRCAVCSANKIRKDIRYHCKDCDMGLCFAPCFE